MNNVLKELLPPKLRLALYALAGLALLGISAWQAAEGNWLNFTAGLAGSLVNVLAAGNTTDTRTLEDR